MNVFGGAGPERRSALLATLGRVAGSLSAREAKSRPGAPGLPAPAGEAVEAAVSASVGGRAAPILCAGCRHLLSTSAAKIAVAGAHAHSFINPAGLIFRVGCFEAAPGAQGSGPESGHWTWFAGFSWQAIVCGRCGEHVGWGYRNGAARFVALIADRIVEEPEAPSTPN